MATHNENLTLDKLVKVREGITRLPFENRAGALSELNDALIDRLRGMIDHEPLIWLDDDLDRLIDNYNLES